MSADDDRAKPNADTAALLAQADAALKPWRKLLGHRRVYVGVDPGKAGEAVDAALDALVALRGAVADLTEQRDEPIGIQYCIVHHGVANADESVCDFEFDDGLLRPCDFRQAHIHREMERAALAEQEPT